MSGGSVVYFLRPVGMAGPVKIGFSVSLERRLKNYRIHSPLALEVAAQVPGDVELERRFHARFLAQRSHYEWFNASEELTATIDAINAGAFDVSTLPEGVKLPQNWALPARSRENASLRHSLYQRSEAIGLRPPAWVGLVYWALDSKDDEERAKAVEAIRRYLSDPLQHGIRCTHPDSQRLFKAYLERQDRARRSSRPVPEAA